MKCFTALKGKPQARSAKGTHPCSGAGGPMSMLLLGVAALGFLVPWPAGALGAQKKAASASSVAKPHTAKSGKTPLKTASAEAGEAARGKKLYDSFGCYECHGHMAEGSVATGPRLAPDPVPFSFFVQQLRHPINQMPPYTDKVVSAQDLKDIYAFLKSVPPPPKVQNIPGMQ